MEHTTETIAASRRWAPDAANAGVCRLRADGDALGRRGTARTRPGCACKGRARAGRRGDRHGVGRHERKQGVGAGRADAGARQERRERPERGGGHGVGALGLRPERMRPSPHARGHAAGTGLAPGGTRGAGVRANATLAAGPGAGLARGGRAQAGRRANATRTCACTRGRRKARVISRAGRSNRRRGPRLTPAAPSVPSSPVPRARLPAHALPCGRPCGPGGPG